MKRSLLILVLSIIGSFVPNTLLAAHATVSNTNGVSLLALDTSKIAQTKNSGIANLLKGWGIGPKTTSSKQKVISQKIVEKTNTQTITQSQEEAKALKKATLPNMVKAWGYNRKTDRVKLAHEAGIKYYRGTMKQNTLIKNFLLSKVLLKERTKKFAPPEIVKSSRQVQDIKKLPLYKTATLRGYIREIDREALAAEAGIVKYVGSKRQNLLIKQYLRKKLKVKKST